MCGLWGYAGPGQPDLGRLAAAATLAAKRGPDGWGITTEDGDRRGLGRLPEAELRALRPGRVVLGHCRLATVLGTRHVGASQPIRCRRFVVAHNGTVANADDLAARFALQPTTGNDSEVIALLLEALPGPVSDRLARVLDLIDHGGHYALAVLDLDDLGVTLRARGIPLWRHTGSSGTYWASIRPGMEWGPVNG